MTGEIRTSANKIINDIDTGKCSKYTMASVAISLLFCVGIIIYAVICG